MSSARNTARDLRVERVNDELRARGLPPIFLQAGDCGAGEDEIVELVRIDVNRHYAAIHLRTRLPGGQPGDYLVETNVQLLRYPVDTGKGRNQDIWLCGLVVVPTVHCSDGRFLVLSQQSRLTQQGFPRANELPRSFFASGDGFPGRAGLRARGHNPIWKIPDDVDWQRLPLGGVRSKLQPLLATGLVTPMSFQVLGVVAEDTGRSLNQFVVAHLVLSAPAGFADRFAQLPAAGRKWRSVTGIEGRLTIHPLERLLWDADYRRNYGGRDVHTFSGLDAFVREVVLANPTAYGLTTKF